MKNRLFVLVLCSVFFLSSTAQSASNMLDIVKDSQSTGASSWTDDTGMSFHSAGHVSYRFKDSASFPLFLDAKAPSVEIGCDGFDLNGGFVSILGWDAIEDQLSEAGTSVLYGAVLIIVSSTPILGDVIDKIQKWSRLIQQILQNSCEITKNLGRNLVGGAITDQINESIMSSDAANGYNFAMSGIETAYQAVDKWVDTAANGNEEQVAVLLAPLFKKSIAPREANIKNISSVGVTAPILSASLDIKSNKNFLIINSATKLLDGVTDMIDLKTGESKETVKAKLFWGTFLFGDFLIKQSSIASLTDIATKTGAVNKEKIGALAKASMKSADSLLMHPEYKMIVPPLRDDIVSIFINGFGSLNHDLNNATISVPSYLTLVYNIELQKLDEAKNGHSVTGTGNYIKGIVSLDSFDATGQEEIEFTWSGYDEIVNSKLFGLIDSNVTSVANSSITPLNPFSDTGSYIKVLRRYYTANHGEYQEAAATEIKTLGQSISFYNAKALYYMIRSAVLDKIYGNKDSNGLSAGGDKIMDYIKIVNSYDKMYLKQFAQYAKENKIIPQAEVRKKIGEIKQMLDRNLKQNRQN